MQRRRWFLVAGLAALAAALPAHAGGPGPISISAVGGRVEIKPLEPGGTHGVVRPVAGGGRAVQWTNLAPGDHWRRVRPGFVTGTYLLRTGPRSWAHLEGGRWCVDPGSLVRIESYADYRIVVLRGRVSAADGRRGPSLFREWASNTAAGKIR